MLPRHKNAHGSCSPDETVRPDEDRLRESGTSAAGCARQFRAGSNHPRSGAVRRTPEEPARPERYESPFLNCFRSAVTDCATALSYRAPCGGSRGSLQPTRMAHGAEYWHGCRSAFRGDDARDSEEQFYYGFRGWLLWIRGPAGFYSPILPDPCLLTGWRNSDDTATISTMVHWQRLWRTMTRTRQQLTCDRVRLRNQMEGFWRTRA